MNDTSNSIQLIYMQFVLLLFFAIPSTFCSIYIIYSFIRFSSIRKSFYYEMIIYLSFIVLLKLIFNISISLIYYSRGYVQPATENFCHFWQYADYTSTACIIWCNAIFTIERYILVFYPHYLRSKRQKIIFHYLPIILSNLYIIIFYIYNIIILSCGKEDFNRHLCGEPCLEMIQNLSLFNWFFNILLPVFIVIFGSLILLIRVLWTRRKMQRNLRNWSKNWKMIVQLLGIAVVYTLVWLPLSVVSFISMFTTDPSLIRTADDYIYHLTYISDMSVSIVAFIFSPEIHRHLRRQVQPNTIASITTAQH